MSREMRTRVLRGIAVLNRRRPSWSSKINTQKLDLGSCTVCVLGQLYSTPGDENGYARGLALLNGEVEKDPTRFGFELDYGESDYEELTEIWRAEIAKQRALRRAAA